MKNGKKIHNDGSIKYYKDGKLHREDGPAVIFESDIYSYKIWMQNGKKHRLDGPAYVEYYMEKLSKEIYYKNDKLHREDGPAYTVYNNGKAGNKTYALDDVAMPIDKWHIHIRKYRLQKLLK